MMLERVIRPNKIESYHLLMQGDYWEMPGTQKIQRDDKPMYRNLAPHSYRRFEKDFLRQAASVDIDSTDFIPLVDVFVSGPGNGKSTAIQAEMVFRRNNLVPEVNVSFHDYRFSLLRAISLGLVEDNRDKYHTEDDYKKINPVLWEDIEGFLGWNEQGRRNSHLLVLEIPWALGKTRTWPLLQKLAQMDREGKIKARVVFAQGNPIVRQIGVLKRMSVRETINVPLPDAKQVFWEWGLNIPQSDMEKRTAGADGAPISQMIYWNQEIDDNLASWVVANQVAMPFLNNRVFTNIEEFKAEILSADWTWCDPKRRLSEITEGLINPTFFGSSEVGPLVLRDLAIGLDADRTLCELFGEDKVLTVYDAPLLGELIDPPPPRKMKIGTTLPRRKLGLRPALRIIRGMDRMHGMSTAEYMARLRDNGLGWLDKLVLDKPIVA